MHERYAHARTTETVLHVYVREPRRRDKATPVLLRPLNNRMQQAIEYEMTEANDFMTSMTNGQWYRYLLKMKEGMSEPIFNYTWSRGGSRASVSPHVIWRIPLKLENNSPTKI